MPESLRDEIDKILTQFEAVFITQQEAVESILTAIKKRLPEWKPAHTYASENADEYRAYDNGFKDCLKQMKSILGAEDAEG